MSKKWPTKIKDLHLAQVIMEEFATKEQTESLGLLELVVNETEKRMNFRISQWVLVIAERFNELYGPSHGEFVTRQVITRCMTSGQTLH